MAASVRLWLDTIVLSILTPSNIGHNPALQIIPNEIPAPNTQTAGDALGQWQCCLNSPYAGCTNHKSSLANHEITYQSQYPDQSPTHGNDAQLAQDHVYQPTTCKPHCSLCRNTSPSLCLRTSGQTPPASVTSQPVSQSSKSWAQRFCCSCYKKSSCRQ